MIIGIDVGSKFIKIASNDKQNGISHPIYSEHYGNPKKEVSNLLNLSEFIEAERVFFCGQYGEYLSACFNNTIEIDEISAIIEGQKYFEVNYRHIVSVGAGSIKYIKLDDKGNFYSYRENSLCAAGTGSFLDEQMHRMNFNYETLTNLNFIQNAPDIATRCAVFAKSDLIHRQQEGYTKEEMWSGLCRGVVTTMLHSVFKGDIPKEDILFCGGLFLNKIVIRWVKEIIDNAFFHDSGHFFSAIGTIIDTNHRFSKKTMQVVEKNKIKENITSNCLRLKLSSQVNFNAKKVYISNGNEVRIHEVIEDDTRLSIGVDIGSTSTKLVVIDVASKKVLIDIYRKTGGNPINATKKLFEELKFFLRHKQIKIINSGTTGSGRKLIGKIIGADTIVNEITAHFKGATYFDNTIETIFEIGGQDAKYIRGYNNAVVDCNMNFVCAAGTGSFIEEQANRLGFDVRDIGDMVIGIRTPHTSDRCTVFMEQDINKLLGEGYSRKEVLAGVIRSISKNYLNRVVGARPITGDKVFFQGATARNKGLVAAFETILQKEILVSPYCHVMGSFGAAILAIDKSEHEESQFRGLDIFNQNIKLDYSKCTKCSNRCKISIARFDDGREESWGYMCGKESSEEEKKIKPTDHFKKIKGFLNAGEKENSKVANKNSNVKPKKIGIPFVLSMYNHLSLWRTFFQELGFEVVVSGKSTQQLKAQGIRISKSDFCFPIKMGLAHFHDISLMDDIDAIFFPSTLSEKSQQNGMPRMLCPYVISFPSIAINAININKKIISPSIDFRYDKKINIMEIHQSLQKYGFREIEIEKAFNKGIKNLNSFLRSRFEYGKKLLNEIKENNKIGIVIIGRPYNLYDKIINLGLTERFNSENIIAFPYEYLINPDDNDPGIQHIYWNYGEKILNTSKKIKEMDNIFPVYFSNFSCGPDSFILSRFERIMDGKPYLIIELDEHGSETGYLTRIEAFIDVVFEKNSELNKEKKIKKEFNTYWKKTSCKLWIPHMHDLMGGLFSAAFKAWGYNAEALPMENNHAFELGKQNVRGSECLPASTTIGIFLSKLKEINAKPEEHALFMPTAEGPCRFGQYTILHRSILDKNGFHETKIFSPSSTNSYMGMPSSLRRCILDSMMAGDIIMKYICKIRPYEVNKGEVDATSKEVISKLEKNIEKKENIIDATSQALERLYHIPLNLTPKPLVGIVGEIYVRCNSFCNNNLIGFIENNGGEAWLSPASEWVIYVATMERYFSKKFNKNIFQKLFINIKTGYMINRLHEFEHAAEKYLSNRMEPDIERVISKGKVHLPLDFEGEPILTVGRTLLFLENGADMIVNCAPFGCMPGNITTSLFQNIQKSYNKPIINLFYDGESDINRIVGVYLNNIKKSISDEKVGYI